MTKKIWAGALVLVAVVLLSGCSFSLKSKNLTPEAAKMKVEQYINENLMANGSKATIDKVTEEKGLYKMSVNIGSGQIIDSYVSKDGTKFFPQALEITEKAAATDTKGTADTGSLPKNDKPVVELFVMSYCPYGTQIEKGILPVVDLLGDKIDFQLKFCNYAMHGDKELKENMVQYCIEKNQNAKLSQYLKCFLISSDSASCLSAAKIDTKDLDACVAKTDKTYKVTANATDKVGYNGTYPGFDVFKADNEKYSVQGSPTLIINGAESSSGRDPQSLLTTICSAFNDAPKECQEKLSTDTPAAGFGSGTAATTDSAGCAN